MQGKKHCIWHSMQDKNIKWKYQVHLKWNAEVASYNGNIKFIWNKMLRLQVTMEISSSFEMNKISICTWKNLKGSKVTITDQCFWLNILITLLNIFITLLLPTIDWKFAAHSWHPVYACTDQDCMHVSLAGRGWLELYSYSDKPVLPLNSEIATSRTYLTWVSCFYYLRERDTHTIGRLVIFKFWSWRRRFKVLEHSADNTKNHWVSSFSRIWRHWYYS